MSWIPDLIQTYIPVEGVHDQDNHIHVFTNFNEIQSQNKKYIVDVKEKVKHK
jgi:hypothetical protein